MPPPLTRSVTCHPSTRLSWTQCAPPTPRQLWCRSSSTVRTRLGALLRNGRKLRVQPKLRRLAERSSLLNNRTYALAQDSLFAAVLYLSFVFRFFALRAKKRKTAKT